MKIFCIRVFKIIYPLCFMLVGTQVFSSESSESMGPCAFCGVTTIPYAAPLQSTVSWEDVKNDRLGNCLVPPNYKDIIKDWKRFQKVAEVRTTANAKRLSANMKVSAATQKYMKDLKSIQPLANDLEIIKQSPWFKNQYAPKGKIEQSLLKYVKSDAFLNNLASQEFTIPNGPNKDKDFWKTYNAQEKDKNSPDPAIAKEANEYYVKDFPKAIKDLQEALRKPTVRAVLNDLDNNQGVSVMDPNELGHYQEFMKFFNDKSESSEAVRGLLSGAGETPLQSSVPLPKFSIETNSFQRGYLKTVDKNMDEFIWKTPLTAEMLKPHLKEKLSTGETLGDALSKMYDIQRSKGKVPETVGDDARRLVAFNAAGAPSKYNLFDEQVATQFFSNVHEVDLLNQANEPLAAEMAAATTSKMNVVQHGKIMQMDAAQLSQVDMVARTLVGEVMDCQSRGLAQAEAVGIVIAQRIQAVTASIKEQKDVQIKNDSINQQNVSVTNSDDSRAKFEKNEDTRLSGRRDFGRPPPAFPTSLPFMPAAEVVSRKLQFSVWNPNLAKTYSTGALTNNPNIPEYKYPIFGPLGVQALIDQTRGLCPEIPKNSARGSTLNTGDEKLWPGDFTKTKPIWDHIADLALEIVQDPQGYLKHYTWKPNPSQKDHIYFYTHGPGLPFARKIDVDVIHDNVANKDLPLRYHEAPGKNPDTCNSFRAWAPKDVGMYETKTH